VTENKYKGKDLHNPRDGLGRLRRAHGKTAGRQSGFERLADDEEAAERLVLSGRRSHSGESLLAKFNRLAQVQVAVGEQGEVSGFTGRTVLVRLADGREVDCEIRRNLKKRIAGVSNVLCAGDRVQVVSDTHGQVIEAVEPRRNQLERGDSHNKALVHVLAANLDRLVIVATCRDPELKPALIDRWLLIANASGIAATLVLNKADLGVDETMTQVYRRLGVTVFTTTAIQGGGQLDELRAHLTGQACVIAGQSGVGKSSLVNALFPALAARTGVVALAGHGRHTTTSARSYVLPGGGRLIDTPGIKECAIGGIEALDVALHYADFAPLHAACRFADCTHRHEPDCAVRAALARGEIAPTRYGSYLAILAEDLGV